jgi:3-hydroxybutyryl-CoA dehydratase
VTAQAPAQLRAQAARTVTAQAPADHADPAPAESVPAESLPTELLRTESAPGEPATLFARPFGELAAGDRFTTPARRVQEGDILGFASLTGDRHPLHVDPDWAAGSRFGEQIAHGLLVLSLAVGLMPLDPDRVVALRRVGDAVFKQPVKIGDTVHVEGEIVRTRELDQEHGLVEVGLRILNQDGRLTVRGKVELVWRADTTAVSG